MIKSSEHRSLRGKLIEWKKRRKTTLFKMWLVKLDTKLNATTEKGNIYGGMQWWTFSHILIIQLHFETVRKQCEERLGGRRRHDFRATWIFHAIRKRTSFYAILYKSSNRKLRENDTHTRTQLVHTHRDKVAKGRWDEWQMTQRSVRYSVKAFEPIN